MNIVVRIFIFLILNLPFSKVWSADMSDYCYIPPFLGAGAPPNVMLMLSIETPMQGAAHPDVTCTGDPRTSYSCGPASCRITESGFNVSNCYNNSVDYYGYFDSNKCYEYSGGIFVPVGNTSNHQCPGKWSGNFLNWATTMALDAMRKAFTGGNRIVDSTSQTVLLGARQTLGKGHPWFPAKMINDASQYTPYRGKIYIIRYSNGFVVCNNINCTVSETGSGENAQISGSGTGYMARFYLKVEVCNPSSLEANCSAYTSGNSTIYKPEGVLQRYSNKMRFGLISYAMRNDVDPYRDGGIVRANVKWISTKIPEGLKYHDASGNIQTCTNVGGCDNPVKEINQNGTLVNNPDNIPGANSGVINYINKFGYQNGYKSYDPISEMYYQIVRYFKNQGPTWDRVCSGLDNVDDGFPVYCNQTTYLRWRDPYLYSCQRSYVIAINDANPWLDKRVPGTSFTGPYHSVIGDDYGQPDSSIDVSYWTRRLGNDEGITPGYICIGCVLGGTCDWLATNKYVTDLSKVAGTCPYPPKQNSYYIAGLAYYAHNEDLRPDLEGKQTLYTYIIDTQESNIDMLVGRYNMLYLAAKFGSFDDINNNGRPDLQVEWDKDNDGFPDGYFFASDPSKIEGGLKRSFEEILKKTSAGTSVSIISEKGSRGATVSQAFFYPEMVYGQNKLSWIGKLQTYWFYNSRAVQNVREDTNSNKILDLIQDRILDFNIDGSGNVSVDYYQSNPDGTRGNRLGMYSSFDNIKVLFEAGELLKARGPSSRTIYALSGNVSLTPTSPTTLQNFVGINSSQFSQYFKLSGSECFGGASSLIDYIRGEDKQGCRIRQTGSGTWKLGDIVYSSPKIVDYGNYSVLFVGANDGMLHAFKLGKLRRDGLSEGQVIRLCQDSSTSCNHTEIGKELWGFVPRHVMPYLKYLADPRYCHLNFVDLSPYIIEEDQNGDGVIDKRILIGGLRFGGSCGCNKRRWITYTWCDPSKSKQVIVPGCNISEINSCVGLSSYFALDITDPTNPIFLWEFADPFLGFSYSGPAYIKHSGRRYVMFVSGPTNYKGEVASGNDLNIFFLKLRSNFTIDSVTKIDGSGKPGFRRHGSLSQYNMAFGGKLFTTGIDMDFDSNTDAVFFGVSQFTGSKWQGNVIGIKPNSREPDNWGIFNLFNSAIEPVTVKIEHMSCFGMNYIYFGTGRWLYKTDEVGQNDQDREKIYGIRIDGCLRGNNCSINNTYNSTGACNELLNNKTTTGWNQTLLPKGSGYFKERIITDPTISSYNLIFFASMQPTEDVCKFGGRTRVWGLNCATGALVSNATCPGYVPAQPPISTLLLQLSGGNIEQISTNQFTNNQTTEWFTGTPPETSTPLTQAGGIRKGEIILWIER